MTLPLLTSSDKNITFPRAKLYALLFRLLLLALFGLTEATPAAAAIIINAPMTDTNSAGWTLGGNPTSALLTGNGTIDPVGNGWLRLTNATGNQTGFAYNNTAFDLSAGLLIEFDYATWGGSGADGYSVYLFDAGVSPFNIGAFGGSLGYAQKLSTAACNPVNPSVPGISGGYVGFGVDEYGNFAYGCEGRYLGAAQQPNTVTIRGSVIGFGGGAVGQTLNATSYPWMATSANNGSLWYNGTPRPSQTGTNYRKVRIQISPAPNPVANVWVAFGYSSPLVYTQMITNQALPAISTSQLLMIGYAASTGGATNYHEIRNLLVSDQTTTSAIDLAITKTFTDITSGSTTTASVGDTIRYTVIASNTGPNNVTANGVGIQDTIPSIITGTTWTCAASGGASCGAASGSGNTINTTANLPLNGYVTYTITGSVGTNAPSLISNTATLVIPGSITDYNSNNDSATVSIPVNSNLSTSTKTWSDPNGGDQDPNDVIPYTITLKETANADSSGVSVTDTFPATLTSLAVTSCPPGATCTIAGQVLTVSNVSVPANGSVSIIVSAMIANGTAAGTLINNTAAITNPSGTGASAAAPAITVSQSQIPLTGNKPLYLYSGPTFTLSRTPPAAQTSWTITTGSTTTLTLLPALQSSVTITTPVTATLWIRRINAAGPPPANNQRIINVRLVCSSNPAVAATGTYSGNPGNAIPGSQQNISLTGPATLSCPAGSSWLLGVNNASAAAGRDVQIYVGPGSMSQVRLPSLNVISVSSVDSYLASYPSMSAPASGYYTGGQTVYVRAAVSDPFGSYDIVSAPTLSIYNPSSGLVSAITFTNLVSSTTGTKTYEYAFTVPANGPSGYWTARVTAWEGTEGTVSDTGVGTFQVTLLPNILVLKSVQAFSDPVNTAVPYRSIPGSVMEYTILVSNSGPGAADNNSIVLTDAVPANMTMYVDTGSGDPVTFSCSAVPSCGLTFNYGANVRYTNLFPLPALQAPPNACGNFTYVPSGSYDANVRGICINPTGVLNGSTGPPDPNFTIKYLMRIN